MYERSPIVAALLADALSRLAESQDPETQAVAARMQLRVGDSSLLQTADFALKERPDVCLLDPMFPAKKKKVKCSSYTTCNCSTSVSLHHKLCACMSALLTLCQVKVHKLQHDQQCALLKDS
jgi:Putative SAM-dependent methyltransferase